MLATRTRAVVSFIVLSFVVPAARSASFTATTTISATFGSDDSQNITQSPAVGATAAAHFDIAGSTNLGTYTSLGNGVSYASRERAGAGTAFGYDGYVDYTAHGRSIAIISDRIMAIGSMNPSSVAVSWQIDGTSFFETSAVNPGSTNVATFQNYAVISTAADAVYQVCDLGEPASGSTGVLKANITCSAVIPYDPTLGAFLNFRLYTDVYSADSQSTRFGVTISNDYSSTATLSRLAGLDANGALIPNIKFASAEDGYQYVALDSVPEPASCWLCGLFFFAITGMTAGRAPRQIRQAVVGSHRESSPKLIT